MRHLRLQNEGPFSVHLTLPMCPAAPQHLNTVLLLEIYPVSTSMRCTLFQGALRAPKPIHNYSPLNGFHTLICHHPTSPVARTPAWCPKVSQGMAPCWRRNHIWGVRLRHWAFLCFHRAPLTTPGHIRESKSFFFTGLRVWIRSAT